MMTYKPQSTVALSRPMPAFRHSSPTFSTGITYLPMFTSNFVQMLSLTYIKPVPLQTIWTDEI